MAHHESIKGAAASYEAHGVLGGIIYQDAPVHTDGKIEVKVYQLYVHQKGNQTGFWDAHAPLCIEHQDADCRIGLNGSSDTTDYLQTAYKPFAITHGSTPETPVGSNRLYLEFMTLDQTAVYDKIQGYFSTQIPNMEGATAPPGTWSGTISLSIFSTEEKTYNPDTDSSNLETNYLPKTLIAYSQIVIEEDANPYATIHKKLLDFDLIDPNNPDEAHGVKIEQGNYYVGLVINTTSGTTLYSHHNPLYSERHGGSFISTADVKPGGVRLNYEDETQFLLH